MAAGSLEHLLSAPALSIRRRIDSRAAPRRLRCHTADAGQLPFRGIPREGGAGSNASAAGAAPRPCPLSAPACSARAAAAAAADFPAVGPASLLPPHTPFAGTAPRAGPAVAGAGAAAAGTGRAAARDRLRHLSLRSTCVWQLRAARPGPARQRGYGPGTLGVRLSVRAATTRLRGCSPASAGRGSSAGAGGGVGGGGGNNRVVCVCVCVRARARNLAGAGGVGDVGTRVRGKGG